MVEPLRVGTLSLAIVGLLIAGCIEELPADPLPTEDVAASTLSATTIAWGVTDCRFAVGIMGAEQAKIAPYMPKGFRSLAMQELALTQARDIKGDANIGVEGFVCKQGAGLEGQVANVIYGSVFSAVAVPAEYRIAGMNFHFVKWDVLIPDADRRDLLTQHGLPARDGAVSLTRFEQQGQANTFDATVKIDQVGEFRLQGASAAPMDAGAFREYTPTANGFANFTTKYKGVFAQGAASVTVPSSSWVAKVTGAGSFPAATFSGFGTFYDATIDLPARPAS
jgi:hypothetical protein